MTANSFFGRLRSRTGLPLAIPSSMQFEYALRGGYYTGEYYRYKRKNENGTLYVPANVDIGRWANNSTLDLDNMDGEIDTSGGTAVVGSYLPNLFGLYDTMGNVYELISEHVKDYDNREMKFDLAYLREMVNDETLGKTKENPVIDYFGNDNVSSCWRTMGGSYAMPATCTIWNQGWYMAQLLEDGAASVGVRVSMTVE